MVFNLELFPLDVNSKGNMAFRVPEFPGNSNPWQRRRKHFSLINIRIEIRIALS